MQPPERPVSRQQQANIKIDGLETKTEAQLRRTVVKQMLTIETLRSEVDTLRTKSREQAHDLATLNTRIRTVNVNTAQVVETAHSFSRVAAIVGVASGVFALIGMALSVFFSIRIMARRT